MSIKHEIAPSGFARIQGEVLTWSCGQALVRKFTTTITEIRRCLVQAEFDPDIARDLKPRFAFSRAATVMSEDGLIKRVNEDDTHLYFQLNEMVMVGDKMEYPYQCQLSLCKETGVILGDGTPEGQAAVVKATAMLAEKMEERSANDVTRLIQRLMEQKKRSKAGTPSSGRADMFPISKNRSAYFVFADQVAWIDKVDKFAAAVGATFERLSIAESQQSSNTIRKAVSGHLAKLTGELESAIDKYDTDTRTSTLERTGQRIAELQFLLTARQEFLETEADSLRQKMVDLEAKLKHKQMLITGAAADELDAVAPEVQADVQPNIVVDTPAPASKPEVGTSVVQDADESNEEGRQEALSQEADYGMDDDDDLSTNDVDDDDLPLDEEAVPATPAPVEVKKPVLAKVSALGDTDWLNDE